MEVSDLEISYEDENNVYVEATIEDMILTHRQTLLDSEEYGPARCFCFINLSELSEWTNEIGIGVNMEDPIDAVREYLEYMDYDLNWELCEDY